MTILLDSVELAGFDHRLTVTEQIERKDLSGATSATAGSHGGWKPAMIAVTCRVRMDDPVSLAALRILWQTRAAGSNAGSETPRVWQITHPTCKAMGIGRAQFSDFFKVAQAERERLWEVAFTLIEVKSIPGRLDELAAPTGAANVEPPPGTETTAGAAAETWKPEGWLEQGLIAVDKVLGNFLFEE